MKAPEFAKANGEFQLEMSVIRALVIARSSQNLTRKELSEKADIVQTKISNLEKGTRIPTIKLLQRLADRMDMVLNIFLHQRKPLLFLKSSNIF